jgi:hypothetical protein
MSQSFLNSMTSASHYIITMSTRCQTARPEVVEMVALLGAIVAAAAAGEYPCVGPEPCPGYPFPPRCAAPCPAHCLLLCWRTPLS